MPLTVLEVKSAKPQAKACRLPDGGGLNLYVTPSGIKSWQYRYRLEGKEQIATLGNFPALSLEDARKAHMEAREFVKQGITAR